jgi:phosphoribosylformimino-5-aminoimidazole carboxamide ribotide isomerase
MIAVPAVDLRDGACVQLVGGDYDAERVRLDDPLAVARRWRDAGFARLHVVDLDAATGRGDNAAAVAALLAQGGAEIQVGGGVRDDARLDALLPAGAARIVCGTRAVEDPAWLAAAAARHPGRVVVAADVRGREVATRGWAGRSGRDVFRLLDALAPLPLAGLLVTAVHREGRMAGPDLSLVRALAARTRIPLLASGGIGGVDDLRRLQEAGAAEAVVGMALYTGALDPRAVAEEFRS